ncbi:MAG: MFS transporter [Candidatus Binatia bacterium]
MLLALNYLAFIALGLPDGLIGVAWPSVRVSFGLPLDAVAGLLFAFTSCYVLASFASGWLLARMSVGMLLAASCVATAASLAGYAAAPTWSLMIAAAAVGGLGAGAIDVAVNHFVSASYGPRILNWMHAAYGMGAAGGPLVMRSALGAGLGWRSGYALTALAEVALAAAFIPSLRRWPPPPDRAAIAGPRLRPASMLAILRLRTAWLGIANFLVYTGLEMAAGIWVYSLFTISRGVSMSVAALWVAIYWASLTLGRIVFGFVVEATGAIALVRGSILAMGLGATLVWLEPTTLASFLGFALIGLAAGPVFPCLMSGTAERVGEANAAYGVGLQIAAAALGQSFVPGAVGAAAGALGLEVVGPALAAGALILFCLHELMAASLREPARDRPTVEEVAREA